MAATITTVSRTTRTPASCPLVNPRSEARRRRGSAVLAGGILLLGAAASRPPRALALGLRPPAAAPAAGSESQGPSGPWRTLVTPHYRVHYPEPYAAWAQRAAAELETVRDRAIAEIGYAPADAVDVVVSDPPPDANGEALPLRGWPRLVLWTTPAPPDSEIGYYRDSIEDLLAHEEAHLVHLLRPSRNPLLAGVLAVRPVALAPRCVVAGSATVVEGRLTAAGRPNGRPRAALLRRL